MSRFTKNDLADRVLHCNNRMADNGSKFRIIQGHRNGYHAADVYLVDDNGDRIGSGVERLIALGTAREVAEACSTFMYAEIEKAKDEKIKLLEKRLGESR